MTHGRMRAGRGTATELIVGDAVLGEWPPDGAKIAFIKVTWRTDDS